MISYEMIEIMGVSDRIITMQEGQVTDEFTKEEVSEEKLLLACAHD